MANEKSSQMNARQKTIIAAVIVIILIIIWQVMSLFPKSTPTPAPVAKAAQNNMSASGGNQNAPVNAPAQQVEQLHQAPLPPDPQFANLQKTTEVKYVNKLNELEDLKIQRQIAETNQAISAAKLATVTAEKDISDLLTKPAPPAPLAPSAYATQLVTPTSGHPVGEPPPAPKEVVAAVDYSVISVSMQLHKWSAVLGYQGRLFNVSVGDILPIDHSVVTNINRNGISLRKDGQTRKISMVSSI